MGKKIVKFTLVASAVAVVVLASVLMLGGLRRMLIENNEMLAHSVAQELLPALLVNDEQQVQALVKSLESYPAVASAELLNGRGAELASYSRTGDMSSASFALASAEDDP